MKILCKYFFSARLHNHINISFTECFIVKYGMILAKRIHVGVKNIKLSLTFPANTNCKKIISFGKISSIKKIWLICSAVMHLSPDI